MEITKTKSENNGGILDLKVNLQVISNTFSACMGLSSGLLVPRRQ